MRKFSSRECPVMNGERDEWAPTRAERLASVKAGWPTSREAQGHGGSVVVCAGESVSQYMAKGDRRESEEQGSTRNAEGLNLESWLWLGSRMRGKRARPVPRGGVGKVPAMATRRLPTRQEKYYRHRTGIVTRLLPNQPSSR